MTDGGSATGDDAQLSSTAFGHYGETEHVSQSWLAALFTSSIAWVVLAAFAVLAGKYTKDYIAPAPPPVDVKFVEKVVEPEPLPEVKKPEPPPLPKIEPKPQPQAPAAAAVVPKNMKVRQLEAPPPPKELVAPQDMPTTAPAEADPSLDKGIAVYGQPGSGDPAGLEGGVGNGPGSWVGGFYLPEGAIAPKPYKSNRKPPYPAAAKSSKKTGLVLIKGVVRADGELEQLEVLQGEDPFAEAALKTVRGWKYQPAQYQGQLVSAGLVIEINFKLKTRA